MRRIVLLVGESAGDRREKPEKGTNSSVKASDQRNNTARVRVKGEPNLDELMQLPPGLTRPTNDPRKQARRSANEEVTGWKRESPFTSPRKGGRRRRSPRGEADCVNGGGRRPSRWSQSSPPKRTCRKRDVSQGREIAATSSYVARNYRRIVQRRVINVLSK